MSGTKTPLRILVMWLVFSTLAACRPASSMEPPAVPTEHPTPLAVPTQPGTAATPTAVPDDNPHFPEAALPIAALADDTAFSLNRARLEDPAIEPRFVEALVNVNLRAGPGVDHRLVGWIAAGQTAAVTGRSPDLKWWRVICPDGTVGDCWVSAGDRFTQPVGDPAAAPLAADGCGHAAAFVEDITVPDDTRFQPGELFTKVWRVRNSGSCTWNEGYALVFVSGDRLDAAADRIPFSHPVRPGETIDLGVVLKAPAAGGSWQGNWAFDDGRGTRFGIGRSSGPVWVKITVDQPVAAGSSGLSGFAWQDRNQDNQASADEMLGGVLVHLATGDGCVDELVSTTTGADGRFLFRGLEAGSYCLLGREDGVTRARMHVILGEDQTLSGLNLAWPQTAGGIIIAGSIYHDLNENLIFDPGDLPAAGREVWLKSGGCDAGSPLVSTTRSNESGRYIFHENRPGRYCVGMTTRDGDGDTAVALVEKGQILDYVNLRAPVTTLSMSH